MITATAKVSQQQIITKAQAEMSTLDKALAEARARVAAIRAETETISARSQERDTSLRTLRETVRSLVQQHEALSAHDELAEGTLAAGHITDQVKAAERERRKTEKALQEAQTKAASDEAKDQARLQALEAERVTLEHRQDDLTRRREAVEQVIRDAQAAMGEGEYKDIVSHLEHLKAQLAAYQKAKDEASFELDAFAIEALQRLAPWSDLQRKIKPQLPYSDASTRVIDAALTLFEALIEEGRASDVHPDIMRAAGLGWDTLTGLLTTQAQWLWPALTGQRPDMLIDKCERLKKVRKAICEVKR